jgi:Ca2+-binding EF-hand superfamily protein
MAADIETQFPSPRTWGQGNVAAVEEDLLGTPTSPIALERGWGKNNKMHVPFTAPAPQTPSSTALRHAVGSEKKKIAPAAAKARAANDLSTPVHHSNVPQAWTAHSEQTEPPPAPPPSDLGGNELERLKQVRNAFEILDEDGNGTLSQKEIAQVAQKLGHSIKSAELDKAMDEMLPDNEPNAEVTFAAFQTWFLGCKDGEQSQQETKLRELFDGIDEDNSGAIDKGEFAKLSAKLGDKLKSFWSSRPLDVAFSELDVDGDGTVTFDEFRAWWWKKDAVREKDHLVKTGKKLETLVKKKRKNRWKMAAKLGIVLRQPSYKVPSPAEEQEGEQEDAPKVWSDAELKAFSGKPEKEDIFVGSIHDAILPNYNFNFLSDPYDPYCPLPKHVTAAERRRRDRVRAQQHAHKQLSRSERRRQEAEYAAELALRREQFGIEKDVTEERLAHPEKYAHLALAGKLHAELAALDLGSLKKRARRA